MSFKPALLCAFTFTLAASPCARCAEIAFAKAGSQVVAFPVGDPASATPIGPLADAVTGLDFDPAANVLWAIDFTSHTLGTINLSSAAYTSTVMVETGITAFTIDPVGGTFLVAKGDQYVYGLDPVTGQTTLQGAAAAAGSTITALAAACGNRVFALAATGTDLPNLYRTQLGAAPALIGPSAYSGPTSLEFDNRSGVLYAWFLPTAGGNTTSTYATIDAATGQTTPLGQFDGRYRMAIRNECSIFADDFEA